MGLRLLFCFLGIALLQTACTQGGFTVANFDGSQTNLGSSGGQTSISILTNSYETQALTILQTNCVSCHTATSGPAGIYGFGDVNHLVSSGLVVPGNPSQSTLYVMVSTSVMPPTGPLSASDQQVLKNWITGTPSATPTPTPTPGSGSNPNATFSYIQANIISKSCAGCHNAFTTYDGLKAEVVAGDANSSTLFTKVNTGEMPQGGPFLSVDQIRAIYDWIQAGALNN